MHLFSKTSADLLFSQFKYTAYSIKKVINNRVFLGIQLNLPSPHAIWLPDTALGLSESHGPSAVLHVGHSGGLKSSRHTTVCTFPWILCAKGETRPAKVNIFRPHCNNLLGYTCQKDQTFASFAWSYTEPFGSCVRKARYEASQNVKNCPLRKSRMEIQRQQELLKLPLVHRLALYT